MQRAADSGHPAPDTEARDLRTELSRRFQTGPEKAWSQSEFNALALRVFRYQFRAVPLYGRYCAGRGALPDSVKRWTEIPAVPASAFKRFGFHATDQAVAHVFRTSGTTDARGERGEHYVADLSLYEDSLISNFRVHVIPDIERPAVVCLLSSPDQAPDSSLSWMMNAVTARLGGEGGGFFLHPRDGLDVSALEGRLDALAGGNRAVLVAGTAFALAMWAEQSSSWRVRLPPGSVVMDTGGFKGRTREVSREQLHASITERLQVPASRIVGEYGMTELLSQYYEPVLRRGAEDRFYIGPPWLRAQILDPATLRPVPEGTSGILCHLDLANLFSVASVLTEDRAEAVGDGFRMLGRSPGAEPRGCSLAVEEIDELARGERRAEWPR